MILKLSIAFYWCQVWKLLSWCFVALWPTKIWSQAVVISQDMKMCKKLQLVMWKNCGQIKKIVFLSLSIRFRATSIIFVMNSLKKNFWFGENFAAIRNFYTTFLYSTQFWAGFTTFIFPTIPYNSTQFGHGWPTFCLSFYSNPQFILI